MCFETVGRVVALPEGEPGTALVDLDDTLRRISLVVLDVDGIPVAKGDWLLTHTGLAVAKLTPAHAHELIEQRRAMRAGADLGAP